MIFQSEFNFSGAQLRDTGMQLAVDHADAVHEKWSEKAYQFFLTWIKTKGTGKKFKVEDFRMFVINNELLPEPPSNRAFGSIVIRAAKEELIIKAGYTTVSNPKAHKTPCTLWEVG